MHRCPFCFVLVFVILGVQESRSQETLLDIDTTRGIGKMFLSVFKRYDQLRFSGYIQTQFQAAAARGAKTFSGGDFSPQSDNRFMLRRGRIRIDYAGFNEEHEPNVFFVFQFDGTERGVNIRDFWGRIFDTRWHIFSVTTGMFARPMGFEVTRSSVDRESPERGRMSQILMPTERDLGAMLTFEPRGGGLLSRIRADVGLFNGQGLSGPAEFDSRKDLIVSLSLQPFEVVTGIVLSANISRLEGGVAQGTKYRYRMETGGAFSADSSESNLHAVAPRRYTNADAQVRIEHAWGSTELRGEYVFGTQPGSQGSSRIGSVLPLEPTYQRKFDGAYVYLLQSLFASCHQLVVKYDWYDPNVDVTGSGIGRPGTFTGEADIRYATTGVGYTYYASENLKVVLFYERIVNEPTLVSGFTGDVRDDVLTVRLQYRF
jgi:hypothetical protein